MLILFNGSILYLFFTKIVRHESHGHTYAANIISTDSKWKGSCKSNFEILINVEQTVEVYCITKFYYKD